MNDIEAKRAELRTLLEETEAKLFLFQRSDDPAKQSQIYALERGAAGSDQIEQGVGVVAPIGDDVAAFEAVEQEGCRAQVMGLSGG